MLSHPIRVASLTVALVLVASCSRQGGPAQDTEAGDTSSPPNISPTAAPGVAFKYSYDFNLSDERISLSQEAHASACEKLGISRCRITGMSYSVDQDEQVTAELDLRVDPVIARQFGKSAQQLVESNDGKLIRLGIGSSDEGQAIQRASKQSSDRSAQIAQLQEEFAKTKPGTAARANLMSQIQALQQQASEQARVIEASQAALANTPMEFHYYGRGGVPGFHGNPLREAWKTFVTTVVWLAQVLLQVLAVLIPVGVLLAIFVALWRTRPIRVLRHWFRGTPEESSD